MKPIVTGGVLFSALLLFAGQQVVDEPPAGPFAPYIDASENGVYVDWLNGHVGVRGSTTIFKKIAVNRVFYLQTKTAAEMEGHARMLPVVEALPRDGKTLVGADNELRTRISERVGKEKAAEILNDTGSTFEVLVKTPLWGSDSLIRLVLGEPAPAKETPSVTTAGVAANRAGSILEAPTGLIVDAREIDNPVAGLLPRLIDEKGHLIHSLESADPGIVRDRGLVVYGIVPPGVNPLSGGARQGDLPIMVKAVSTAGATRADLIIRQSDADRITASQSAFLRECRVIILMPPAASQKPRPAPRRTSAPETGNPGAADPNLN